MKNEKKKLPIGIENFEEIQSAGFYYIDKSYLIKELLENWAKVTLFTRPRRFGKSLNMSMLKKFLCYLCARFILIVGILKINQISYAQINNTILFNFRPFWSGYGPADVG